MNIKMIFSDVDNTLLDTPNWVIPKRNLDAVKKAVNKGVRFVLNSGRSFDSMRQIADKLLLGPDAFLATLGGSLLFKGNGIIDSHTVDRTCCLEILKASGKMGIDCHMFHNRDWYAPRQDEWFDSELKASLVKGTVVDPDVFLGEHDPHKLILISRDPGLLKDFSRTLDDYENYVGYSYSSPYFMEVNPAGVSKGTVITYLCSTLKIRQDEVLSIGDFYNDVDMFKVSGYSVAMGNSPDDVKSQASMVVSSCPEGGFAEALERLVL